MQSKFVTRLSIAILSALGVFSLGSMATSMATRHPEANPAPIPPAPELIAAPAPATPAPVRLSDGPINGSIRAFSAFPVQHRAGASAHLAAVAQLPPKVDLAPLDGPIFDQGAENSCTGNAAAGIAQFEAKNKPGAVERDSPLESFLLYWRLIRPYPPRPAGYVTPSRNFIYMLERILEGHPGYDNGAAVQTGAKVLSTYGYPAESAWPYNRTTLFARPGPDVMAAARANVTPAMTPIDTADLASIKASLSRKHPVMFGFDVYASFQQLRPGAAVYVPSGRWVGGHAVVAVGYDDATQTVKVRNSWGTGWGEAGYFFFRYADFTSQQTSDAWTFDKPAAQLAAEPPAFRMPAPAPRPALRPAA